MPVFVRFRDRAGRIAAGVLSENGDIISVIEEPFWEVVSRTGETFSTGDVSLLPPCEPRSIVCVGLNYQSHLNGRPVPDPPTLFQKPLSSISGPGDDIVLPRGAGRVDPEGEIVVVIGRKIRGAQVSSALESVFGYTCGNDVSAREWQQADGQWWRAKGTDSFGVFGPAIATGLDPRAIELQTRVNGNEVQRALSSELILGISEVVSLVSAHMTLEPGDVIFTGTPGSPPALKPGDVVEVEVKGAGILRNGVVQGE